MADKKISQLPAATLPLAGTELLPIVQSGTTDNITVNNLAAGNIKSNATTGVLQVTGPAAGATRVMTTPDANFTVARIDAANSFTADQTLSTGNLVIGTSGKGIDFSATSGTGTSELLADYEEGTFTPTIILGGGSVTYTAQIGTYTKVGRLVTVQIRIAVDVATTPSSTLEIGGMPYVISATQKGSATIMAYGLAATAITTIVGAATAGTSNLRLYRYAAGTLDNPGGDVASGCSFAITCSYEV